MAFVPFFVVGWVAFMAALWMGPHVPHRRRLMALCIIVGGLAWVICGYLLHHGYHTFLFTVDS